MSAIFIDSYNKNTQNRTYQNKTKKTAARSRNQTPADSQDQPDAGQRPTDIKKLQTALMETFEKMRNTGLKSETSAVTDPFGLNRKTAGDTYASYADESGIIEYNGVRFTTNEKGICLGDVSNPGQVIRIALSTGEELQVNRNSIGELSRAIGMFSPKDQNRILRALQIDAKMQEVKAEIAGMGDDVGKGSSQQKTDSAKNAQKKDGAKNEQKTNSVKDIQETDSAEDTQGTENIKRKQATDGEKDRQEKTEIIVKPDGSRVLVTTVHIGGMETVMSMEITGPKDENL